MQARDVIVNNVESASEEESELWHKKQKPSQVIFEEINLESLEDALAW